MISPHYNNVTKHTLANMTAEEATDSAEAARKVVTNCGVGFPRGDSREIMLTLLSNDYMGWVNFTRFEAQQMANNGIAAVGVSPERVVVIITDDESASNSLIESGDSVYAAAVSELSIADTYSLITTRQPPRYALAED